ncbi:MAG: glycosyltransferase family 4 protein [Verrucomicrobiales bacterium]
MSDDDAGQMTTVLIHSPYPRQRSQGNAVTAKRMTALLREEGLDVAIHERGDAPMAAQCLIALNARKSAKEIFEFHHRQPDSQIVALLTGTDVNHPDMLRPESDTRAALELASAIVSLHEGFSHRIADDLLEKTQVIYPSVRLPQAAKHQPGKTHDVVIAGNFRAEKNPDLMLQAVRGMVGQSLNFHAYGLGGDFLDQLEQTAAECANFHYHGVQDHEVVLANMQTAHVLLNTSTEEGGANAVCEAVALGLPVVASKIAGNIGMLGDDYAGFFRSGDPASLVHALDRSLTDDGFYRRLKGQVAERAHLFSPRSEARRWGELIRRLLK